MQKTQIMTSICIGLYILFAVTRGCRAASQRPRWRISAASVFHHLCVYMESPYARESRVSWLQIVVRDLSMAAISWLDCSLFVHTNGLCLPPDAIDLGAKHRRCKMRCYGQQVYSRSQSSLHAD